MIRLCPECKIKWQIDECGRDCPQCQRDAFFTLNAGDIGTAMYLEQTKTTLADFKPHGDFIAPAKGETPPVVFDNDKLDKIFRKQLLSQRLKEQSPSKDNWGSHGELPPTLKATERALQLLCDVVDRQWPTPDIFPTAVGGMQLEWAQDDGEIELEITPEGLVDCNFDGALFAFAQKQVEETHTSPHFTFLLARFTPYNHESKQSTHHKEVLVDEE
jgi:hypothetical protein